MGKRKQDIEFPKKKAVGLKAPSKRATSGFKGRKIQTVPTVTNGVRSKHSKPGKMAKLRRKGRLRNISLRVGSTSSTREREKEHG